jgi:hypothetical protein
VYSAFYSFKFSKVLSNEVKSSLVLVSVSDPDPAFYAEYRSDQDPIRIQGFGDQNFKKWTAKKTGYFFDQKLKFTYP